MSLTWAHDLLRPDCRLDSAGGELLSALDPDDRGSRYDRGVAAYDRVVASRLYNHLVWRTSPARYGDFAAAAVADGAGPLLDVGCGSAVFTAGVYRTTRRPLVLVDRSLGMLGAAAKRLRGHAPDRVAFVQADLFDLPFRHEQFTTVTCHGLLHLFDDMHAVLHALQAQLAAGGSLHVTSLVSETALGTQMLKLLHRSGEAAAPRRIQDLAAVTSTVDSRPELWHTGSMAFMRWAPPRRVERG